MKISCIYEARIKNYWYIGGSKNLYNRMKYRKSQLLNGKCHERKFQDIFNQYKELPTYSILEKCSEERIKELEIQYYEKYSKKYGIENSMNILKGGENAATAKSTLVYKRISERLIGRPLSREHKEKIRIKNSGVNNPNFEKKVVHSEDTKKKMSISRRNRVISEFTKEKIKNSLIDYYKNRGSGRVV